MKFNPKSLKSFFNFIRRSPIDDMAVNAVKNNADDVALGALDVVDDIPKTISLDDIADTYQNRISVDKAPMTSSEFAQNYNTNRNNRLYGEMMDELFPNTVSQVGNIADAPIPEYYEALGLDSAPDQDAMDVRPERFGQSKDPLDFLLYPDGFENPDDFARYHDNLSQGFISKDMPAYTYPIKQDRYRSPIRTTRTLNALQSQFDPYTNGYADPALIDMYMRLLNSKS